MKALEKKTLISIAQEIDEVPDDEKEACEALIKKMQKIASRPSSKKEHKAKQEAPKAE